MAAYKAQ